MTDAELLAAADAIAERAYAPYSRFHVGCAVLCRDGRVVDLLQLHGIRIVREDGDRLHRDSYCSAPPLRMTRAGAKSSMRSLASAIEQRAKLEVVRGGSYT